MVENKKYIINPNYLLRGDNNRAFITTKYKYPELEKYNYINFHDNFFSFLHPSFASMISFFSGEYTFGEQLIKMESFFGINKETIKKIVTPFLANKEMLIKKEGDVITYIPENIIIEHEKNIPVIKQYIEDFTFTDIDLTTNRLNRPLGCTFMLNTKCVTNCIYCYADRKNINAELSINKVKELIKEAKQIGMKSFDVLGGEFFLYSDWKELLKILIENDYHPYISTKVPISKQDVEYMKSVGLRYIQISLDTINAAILNKMLNVKDTYCEKIKETIENLNNANINIVIHSILTSLNTKKEDIINLLDYLSNIENIIRIRLSPVSYTRFKNKENFEKICCSEHDMNVVNQITNEYKQKYSKEYLVRDIEKLEDVITIHKTVETFEKRGFCTGNTQIFYILPDGKITFCEQMYWSPNFIIGDIRNKSIMEFWNSNSAKKFNINKKNNMSKKSKCYDCKDWEKCHFGKGICWKMVIENYGDENWDFPDPRCPKSPVSLLTFN